jgi:hypothetical protein
MWRREKALHEVRIVGQELPQAPPIVAVALLLEPDDVRHHRQDLVPAQQLDGLAILSDLVALADLAQRLLSVLSRPSKMRVIPAFL